MLDVFDALSFAFREILKWYTMRLALMAGAGVIFLWIIVASIFWADILSLASIIIEWVPFSIIRANGVWMLSTLVWFILVLITYALVNAFLGNLVLNKTSKTFYRFFSLWIVIGSAVVWGVIWIFNSAYIYHQFVQLLTWLPFETIQATLAFITALYLIYSGVIFTLLFVVSSFSEAYISGIEIELFLYEEVITDNEFKSFKYTLRDTGIFLVVSILAFPLLFIPVLNIVVQVGLWVWLIKDTITYDAASLIFKDVSPKKLKPHNRSFWVISVVAALFNFVPILNVFGPFFGELAIYYYLRNEQVNGRIG